MPDLSDLDFRAHEKKIRQQELDIKRAQLAVDFAKYGFAGTLTAALSGMVLITALAVLEALTDFQLGDLGFVSIGFMIFVGCVAFGYLSLWSFPKIVARFLKWEMSVNSDKTRK